MTLFIIIIALYSVIIYSVMLPAELQYILKINMQKITNTALCLLF